MFLTGSWISSCTATLMRHMGANISKCSATSMEDQASDQVLIFPWISNRLRGCEAVCDIFLHNICDQYIAYN